MSIFGKPSILLPPGNHKMKLRKDLTVKVTKVQIMFLFPFHGQFAFGLSYISMRYKWKYAFNLINLYKLYGTSGFCFDAFVLFRICYWKEANTRFVKKFTFKKFRDDLFGKTFFLLLFSVTSYFKKLSFMTKLSQLQSRHCLYLNK